MKILHLTNVFLAGVIDFRARVVPFYSDTSLYPIYNAGRNVSHRLTFHFFED
jgi:hypothetical protein